MGAYELHQKLRTKAVRLVKKKDYDQAIQTLYQGSISLFDQAEQGSACDLALYMIEVYGIKMQSVESDSRDRVTDILSKAQPDFWRKKVIDAAVKWSVNATGSPSGDPLLRLFIAKLLAKESQYHLSESHFISACLPSPTTYQLESAPKAFSQMMLDWLVEHSRAATENEGEHRDSNAIERIEAGRFALRGLMPLLANRALSQARSFLVNFIELATARQKSLLLPVQPNPRPYVPPGSPSTTAKSTDVLLYLTGNPDLNFSQMALALVTEAVQIKSQNDSPRKVAPDWLRNAWMALVRQYEREAAALQQEEGVREVIPHLSQIYFDIQPPRQQGNMLSDMMASLFGGSASPAANHVQAPIAIKQAPPLRPSSKEPSSASGASLPPAQNTGMAQSGAKDAVADDLVDEEMD
ncbi:hypothetical protein IE53DRAFT_390544 [Violaceomyces palustris]|uniref:Uncharacterized protein n=1 Tax=Violaceomyces palustris TaxID=1673888 RepID=A0ACD0NNB3_9BASI|nr:hypothetical protein IE53DRAFT_390544 [Violaceomyces palustris]